MTKWILTNVIHQNGTNGERTIGCDLSTSISGTKRRWRRSGTGAVAPTSATRCRSHRRRTAEVNAGGGFVAVSSGVGEWRFCGPTSAAWWSACAVKFNSTASNLSNHHSDPARRSLRACYQSERAHSIPLKETVQWISPAFTCLHFLPSDPTCFNLIQSKFHVSVQLIRICCHPIFWFRWTHQGMASDVSSAAGDLHDGVSDAGRRTQVRGREPSGRSRRPIARHCHPTAGVEWLAPRRRSPVAAPLRPPRPTGQRRCRQRRYPSPAQSTRINHHSLINRSNH